SYGNGSHDVSLGNRQGPSRRTRRKWNLIIILTTQPQSASTTLFLRRGSQEVAFRKNIMAKSSSILILHSPLRHGRAGRRTSPGHPRLALRCGKTWMAVTSTAMTAWEHQKPKMADRRLEQFEMKISAGSSHRVQSRSAMQGISECFRARQTASA